MIAGGRTEREYGEAEVEILPAIASYQRLKGFFWVQLKLKLRPAGEFEYLEAEDYLNYGPDLEQLFKAQA